MYFFLKQSQFARKIITFINIFLFIGCHTFWCAAEKNVDSNKLYIDFFRVSPCWSWMKNFIFSPNMSADLANKFCISLNGNNNKWMNEWMKSKQFNWNSIKQVIDFMCFYCFFFLFVCACVCVDKIYLFTIRPFPGMVPWLCIWLLVTNPIYYILLIYFLSFLIDWWAQFLSKQFLFIQMKIFSLLFMNNEHMSQSIYYDGSKYK